MRCCCNEPKGISLIAETLLIWLPYQIIEKRQGDPYSVVRAALLSRFLFSVFKSLFDNNIHIPFQKFHHVVFSHFQNLL